MCERACFVETETRLAVEAGVVAGDDWAVELLGVAEDLADVWQGAREGCLVAVGPDDAAREVTACARVAIPSSVFRSWFRWSASGLPI